VENSLNSARPYFLNFYNISQKQLYSTMGRGRTITTALTLTASRNCPPEN
jgi:hypothetical protein